jgi:IS6 family transposase
VRSSLYTALEFGVLGPRLSGRHHRPGRTLYVRYRLRYTEVSEWLAERGVLVDQSTIYRWVQRHLPLFGEAARKYRAPVGLDWRVDQTCARIRGRWHYIYRVIDGHGQIVDTYVSSARDMVR